MKRLFLGLMTSFILGTTWTSAIGETIKGKLTVYDFRDITLYDDKSCWAKDLGYNFQIIVRDQNNRVLSTTTAHIGYPMNDPQLPYKCIISFKLSVPKASFYQIQLGNKPPLVFSYQQMIDSGWQVNLTR